VVDANSEAITGATIVVKGTTVSTSSDVVGRFAIQAAPEATIVVSFLGFQPQEILVGNQTTLNVVLQEDTKQLEEVVVVGYGTQRKVSVTGAVSQIQGEELLKAPVTNVTNLLAGRVAGVVSLQQSGQPGVDGSSLLVRGSGVTAIVDGVERSFEEIDPNDIASVSVLKDASAAAVYGLNASAVIIVTTKRGQVAPSKINFTASYGVSTNAEMLQLLDGPQFAYWFNKGRVMDGNTPMFSEEHVRKMLAGEDGWGNTNWYEKTFGVGTNAQYNINASGGTENIKYFASLGYFDQTGNVKNFNYDRINLRSNIDAKIAKNLTLTFDISGRIENRERSTYGAVPTGEAPTGNNVAQQAARALPFLPTEWNGLPVATPTSSSSINSPLASSSSDAGYQTEKQNILQTTIALNYELPWLKGLSAKFAVSYDYKDVISKQLTIPYDIYRASWPTLATDQVEYVKTQYPAVGDAGLSEATTWSNTLTTNTSLKYENKFDLHNITVLALMETRQTNGNAFNASGYGFDILSLDELNYAGIAEKRAIGGSSSQSRLAGFLGRINYSYAEKYLAEVTMRYDGTYQFAGRNISGARWILTPAASLGWRMSEEEWFKNALSFVDNLKLRGGIGLTGSTGELPAYFFLNTLSFVENSDTKKKVPIAVLGDDAVYGLNTSAPANVNLTWSKALQYNIGFEATLWKGLLGVEFDVFYKYLYDIPVRVSGSTPSSWGGYVYTYDNLDKKEHKGFEIHLSHAHKIGEFSYRIDLNTTYTKRRWLHHEESENLPDYLKLTGKAEGVLEGFVALGLYQTQEEIDNSAKLASGLPRPGDIKYLDRNGDGIITYEQDRGYVGKSAYPEFVGGLSFYGEWKGIDISFLFQGALGRDIALTGVYSGIGMDNSLFTKTFYHTSNTPLYLVENSWTPDNPDAVFPRLSVTVPGNNNAYSSDFWYRNGDYLRLKSLQIGYNIPKKILDYVGISALRIYVEGQNLLTFSELTKYNIDPEQPGVSNGYYPQQRVFAAGIKLTF
jgi:TonB-linked SusC/RagA family outer membrane protein